MKPTLNHYTQEGCNAILGTQLKVDGIIGEKTTSAQKMIFSLIKQKYQNANKRWNHMNFGAIRMSDKFDDQFTDWGFMTKGNSIVLFPMSTKPGWGYVKNKQYIEKVKGVAVLEEQFIYDFWAMGKTSWTGKKYLQQINKAWIIRDDNMDEKIDRLKRFFVNVGINFHSWKNWFSTLVKNLSAGCQVVKADVHDLIFPYIEMALEEQGGTLDYALFHKDNL